MWWFFLFLYVAQVVVLGFCQFIWNALITLQFCGYRNVCLCLSSLKYSLYWEHIHISVYWLIMYVYILHSMVSVHVFFLFILIFNLFSFTFDHQTSILQFHDVQATQLWYVRTQGWQSCQFNVWPEMAINLGYLIQYNHTSFPVCTCICCSFLFINCELLLLRDHMPYSNAQNN